MLNRWLSGREIYLTGCPLVQAACPDSPWWRHPLFSTDAYIQFSGKVHEAVRLAAERLQAAATAESFPLVIQEQARQLSFQRQQLEAQEKKHEREVEALHRHIKLLSDENKALHNRIRGKVPIHRAHPYQGTARSLSLSHSAGRSSTNISNTHTHTHTHTHTDAHTQLRHHRRPSRGLSWQDQHRQCHTRVCL